MPPMTVLNHLGHCVADLDRARRFYVEAFGFEPWREIEPPDEGTAKLLGLPSPVGLTASYLRLGDFVLELLHYSGEPNRVTEPSRRTMREAGLTHLSFSVDVPATCAKVVELGGEVLADTDIGAAVFVRDPDGQLLELLPTSYAENLAAEG